MIARFFRILGFRYAFPIGTLAVPYHPLILPAIFAALAVWVGFSFAPSEAPIEQLDPKWPYPAIIAVLLGVWLSIPVISWFLLPFGGPRLQGLVIGATMVVIVGDVWTGRAHPGFLIFPALFVGLFLYEFVGGPIRLSYLRKANERFMPVSGGGVWFEVEENSRDALALLEEGRLARVASESPKGYFNLTYRLRPEQGHRLTHIARGRIPKGWKLADKKTHWILQRKGKKPAEAIRFSNRRFKDPTRLIKGKLQETRVVDCSGNTQRIFAGIPTLTRIPIFVAFAWTSIVENSTEKYFGFLPRAREQLWPGEKWRPAPLSDLIAEPQEPQFADEDMEELEAEFSAFEQDTRTRVQYFWTLMRSGQDYRDHLDDFEFLCDNAKLLTLSDLDEAVAWLKRSREASDMMHVRAAAKLFDCFSFELLERGKDTVLLAFNSRVLGMAWPRGATYEGKSVYPADTPIFQSFMGEQAGFGLLRDFPYLYARLANVSPRLRHFVTALVKESRWIGTPLAPILETNLKNDNPNDKA